MAIADQPAPTSGIEVAANMRDAYKKWMEAQRIPIHRGYFVEDVRNRSKFGVGTSVSAEPASSARGQEGVTEARSTEIPAGGTQPSQRFGSTRPCT